MWKDAYHVDFVVPKTPEEPEDPRMKRKEVFAEEHAPAAQEMTRAMRLATMGICVKKDRKWLKHAKGCPHGSF